MSQGIKRGWDGLEKDDCEVKDHSPTFSVYTVKSCANTAFSSLNNQRLDGRLCDVVLLSGDGLKQSAHRCVLAASSEYFCRMFEQTGFTDSGKPEIQLHGVPGEALEKIVDFLYTGSLALTTANVHAIVSASDYMLLPAAQKLCVKFMSKVLDSEVGPLEAVKIYLTARRYAIQELSLSVYRTIYTKFKDVSLSQDFGDLCFEDVKCILRFNGYYILEQDIWFAAITWIECDLNERKKHLEELMELVHFPLMTTEALMDVVKDHELMKDSRNVTDMILNAVKYKLFPLQQSKMQTSQTVPREHIIRGLFCLIGTESFNVYMPDSRKWYSLACPLPVQLSGNYNDKLSFNLVMSSATPYAIGKVRACCETERYMVKSIQAYEAGQNAWCEKALPTYKENTVFVECKQCLYACSRQAVEVYKEAQNSWEVLCQHSFFPYDFVYASEKSLRFYSLDSGVMVKVSTLTGEFRSEIMQTASIGPVKGVSYAGKSRLLLTVKTNDGFSHKVFDMKSSQIRNTSGLIPWTSYQMFPLCLDRTQFWHVLLKESGTWLMASHPSIMGLKEQKVEINSVSDGVIPFFALTAKWKHCERLPSIPERPGQPISLCASCGKTGTTAACSY